MTLIPPALRGAIAAGVLPTLLKDVTGVELASAAVHARRLADPDGDILGMERHVAEAKKQLEDAVRALDNLTRTGKFE